MESIANALANGAFQSADAGEEYVGEDGIRRCAKCGEPLAFRRFVPIVNEVRLLPIACACARAEWEREKELNRLALERKQLGELAGFSLMDARAREATFENARETPENAAALRAAKRYVEHWPEMLESSTGLLFYGPPGTGKTYLADCIANALMARGVPVMVSSLLRVTAEDPAALNGILGRMKSARLLVLDDLGAERDTSFKLEQVFSVIDSRYASKRPLIVTTNLSLSELKAGDGRTRRIFDRVLAMCHPVKLDGESWRRREVRGNYGRIRALLGEE